MGVSGTNEGILIKHLRWACILSFLLCHRGIPFLRRGSSAEKSVHQPVNVNSVQFLFMYKLLLSLPELIQ